MNRRSFLTKTAAGLLIPAAPAIVSATNIMPVKVMDQGIHMNVHKWPAEVTIAVPPAAAEGGYWGFAVTSYIDGQYEVVNIKTGRREVVPSFHKEDGSLALTVTATQ